MSPVEQALDNAAAAIAGSVVRSLRSVNDLAALAALSATDGEIALVSGTVAFFPYVAGIYVYLTNGPAADGLNVIASTVVPADRWVATEKNRRNVAHGIPTLDASARLWVGPTAIAPFPATTTFQSEEMSNDHPAGGLVNLLGTTTIGQVPTLGHPLSGSLQWKVRQEYSVGLSSDVNATFFAEDHDEIIGPTTAAAPRAWLLSDDYSALGSGIPPKAGMRVRFVARQTTNDIVVTANSIAYVLRANSGAGHYRTLEFVCSGSEWVLSLGALA